MSTVFQSEVLAKARVSDLFVKVVDPTHDGWRMGVLKDE
jgi:hypothetical protein